jgi:hypothetical protein
MVSQRECSKFAQTNLNSNMYIMKHMVTCNQKKSTEKEIPLDMVGEGIRLKDTLINERRETTG